MMADKIDEDALRFGQMLQSYREGAKVTQQDIADATGLTKNYISSIERGVHKCNAQTFIAYAKKCGVTLVRKYFRLHAHEPPDRIYAELLGYTRPVVSGRADKRNMKPKSAVWFVYRVA